jgi:hypothetical protein
MEILLKNNFQFLFWIIDGNLLVKVTILPEIHKTCNICSF